MKIPRGRPWLAAAAALLLVPLGLLAINAFDEELSPEARALFSRPGVAFAPDSGWALLAGFNAPVDQDPRAYAQSVHSAAQARGPGKRAALPAGEIDVRAASELLCAPQEADCTRAFVARPDSIAELAADNAVMLARYDELLRSTRLGDAAGALYYYSSIAYFNEVLRTQLVRLSQIGAAAGTGKLDQALAWLESDAAFHRRWLDEAGSILTKMLAVRTFSRDLLLAGQIARSERPKSDAHWEALERIAAPLTATQRGVAPVLAAEAWFFAQVVDHLVADPRATGELIDAPRPLASLVGATIKRNATFNFAYPLFADWAALDELPSSELAPEIERIRARIRSAGVRDWRWGYNYFGKLFTAEAPPDLGEYLYRVRDTDALAALIRCAIGLRRSGTPIGAAAPFVSTSGACRDPYGGSLTWDPGSGELSFRPRSPLQVDRFGGRGDRVTFAVYPS